MISVLMIIWSLQNDTLSFEYFCIWYFCSTPTKLLRSQVLGHSEGHNPIPCSSLSSPSTFSSPNSSSPAPRPSHSASTVVERRSNIGSLGFHHPPLPLTRRTHGHHRGGSRGSTLATVTGGGGRVPGRRGAKIYLESLVCVRVHK